MHHQRTGFQNRERFAVYNSLTEHKNNYWFLIQFAVIIIICFLHALHTSHYADFIPINGTFQNFNPVRRFLNGQIPYRDFQDYLGLGHLYAGVLLTWLCGGNYKSSLTAFSFLQLLSFAGIVFSISKSVFKKKEAALCLTQLAVLFILIYQPSYRSLFSVMQEFYKAMDISKHAEKSARFLRGLILPVSILLIWQGEVFYKRLFAKRAHSSFSKTILIGIGFGLVSGIAFVWSNDYGISCWVCLAVICFWLCFSRSRNLWHAIVAMFIDVAISFISIAITVEVLTVGHFSGWISSTFGTGGFQSWYYNSSEKSFYLSDIDLSFAMCIQITLALLYIIRVYREKGSIYALNRYGILGFANMVGFCAGNEYKIISGGHARELSLTILYVTILSETLNLIVNRIKRFRFNERATVATVLLGLAWILSAAKDEFNFRYLEFKGGTYIEQLGGNVTDYGQDLINTDLFLDGANVWATYASAQEVVSGTYQPSGTDYIIHVLGDQQREDYLRKFREMDFDYTATIKDSFYWEYWVQRANWFFYRELYQNWHPVYSNSYELYWERNNNNHEHVVTEGFDISVEKIDEASRRIRVTCGENINGFADVYIDYTVLSRNNNTAKITIQTMLQVINSGVIYSPKGNFYESNYLRPDSSEFIPIRIVNGYGEAIIRSVPMTSTYLELAQCRCDCIYTVDSDYADILSISNDGYRLTIEASEKNINAIRGLQSIEIQNKRYRPDSIETTEEKICFYLNEVVDYDEKFTNQVRLIKR